MKPLDLRGIEAVFTNGVRRRLVTGEGLGM
jgi:hypothetical protein